MCIGSVRQANKVPVFMRSYRSEIYNRKILPVSSQNAIINVQRQDDMPTLEQARKLSPGDRMRNPWLVVVVVVVVEEEEEEEFNQTLRVVTSFEAFLEAVRQQRQEI